MITSRNLGFLCTFETRGQEQQPPPSFSCDVGSYPPSCQGPFWQLQNNLRKPLLLWAPPPATPKTTPKLGAAVEKVDQGCAWGLHFEFTRNSSRNSTFASMCSQYVGDRLHLSRANPFKPKHTAYVNQFFGNSTWLATSAIPVLLRIHDRYKPGTREN